MSRLFTSVGLAASIAVAFAVGGCGGSSAQDTGTASAATSASSGQSTSADSGTTTTTANVPESVASTGKLVVGTDATFAPFEFKEEGGNAINGIDADLAKQIASQLGLDAELVQAPFDSLLPSLQTGKFNIGMSAFSDSEEREQVMNMIQYAQAGNSYFVNAKIDPATVQKPSDLCGKTVAVLKGSANAEADQAQAKKCDEKMTVLVFPDQNAETLAVASGRADVGDTFGPVSAWLVSRSGGKLKLAGENYDGASPIAIAVPKGTGMAQPVFDALKASMQDGSYQKIMQQWHADSNMIDEPVMNPVTHQPAS